MIGYLKGRILDVSLDGKILLGVGGDSPSIGYQVLVPASPAYVGCVAGSVVELYIHTHVREDALDLFGFMSREEKELFLTLLGVNGIGPKAALGLLTKVSPGELIEAIVREDTESLIKVPGIGKKTAERVIVELSDSLRKKVEQGAFAALVSRGSRTGASILNTKSEASKKGTAPSPAGIPYEALEVFADAKDALTGLGYREAEILSALQKVLGADALASAGVPTPELAIRGALRQLMVQR